MSKKILPYELGKIAILLWWLASAASIVCGIYMLLSNAMQLALLPANESILPTLAETSSDKIRPIGVWLQGLLTGVTLEQARSRCIWAAVIFVAGIVSLLFARDQLRRQERRFRSAFMPQVLQDFFTDFTYDPQKRRPQEEPLCDMGLLRSYERYYSANRLQGLYRGCWVAAEEIACGGVYGEQYTSHKVKIRGQWLTVRLNQSFHATVVLERRGSKNRLQHNQLAKSMYEVEFSYEPFAKAFRCYSDAPEEAARLLPRDLADRLLSLLEKYGDFSVIFQDGSLYVLLRRRSFDRRLECVIPYSLKVLRKEVLRLYGPLMDFMDILLF